jgi:hypothetical protein
MALLRWMHLQKLVPLTDLLDGGKGGPVLTRPAATPPRGTTARASSPAAGTAPVSANRPDPVPSPGRAYAQSAAPAARPVPPPAAARAVAAPVGSAPEGSLSGDPLKEALLAHIQATRSTLYRIAIVMARIDVSHDQVTFTFASNQNAPRVQLEQNRQWLEAEVQRLAGRRIPVVVSKRDDVAAPPDGGGAPASPAAAPAAGVRDAKAEALSSPVVQELLDVFPGAIRDVEEIS